MDHEHPEVSRCVEHASSLHERASRELGQGAVEIYVRRSDALHARFQTGRAGVACRRGSDQGTAIRASRGEGVAFAACASGTRDELPWLIDAVRSAPTADADPWAEPEAPSAQLDVDEPTPLPSDAEVEDWLTRARAAVVSSVSGRRQIREGWIDVARTVETVVTPEGAVRTRSRARASGGVDFHGHREPPVRVASRRAAELTPESWRSVVEDRGAVGEAPLATGIRGKRSLLFPPELAARVALGLAEALHRPGASTDLPVGPGWAVETLPRHPQALFGGTFDDTGAAREERRLADGRRVLAGYGGSGCLVRASYRDRPAPRVQNLVVDPVRADAGPGTLLVERLEIHPFGPSWVLEMGGREISAAGAWPRFSVRHARTSPEALVMRCVAGVGPARRSHLGVVTPALLFEDVAVGEVE